MKRGLIQWDKNEVPIEEFQSRIKKTKAMMQSRGVDSVAVYGDACQSNNLSYLTNFFPYADTGLFVLPMTESPGLFTTHAYRNIPWFNTITWVKDIVCTDDIGGECVKYMKAAGLDGKKIGLVHTRALPYPVYFRIQDGLTCCFIDLTEDFEKIRMAKTPVEKKLIEKAAHIAGLSFERVKETFCSGISGYELASEVELVARKNGAEDVLCLVQPDCSPYGLSLPTSKPIQMMCAVEVSVEYQGYWAKIGQTLISAEAPREYAIRWEGFVQGCQRAARILRVGIPFSSWLEGLRSRLEKLPLIENIDVYFDPGLEPYWGTHRKTNWTFQNDMAFFTKVILKYTDQLQLNLTGTYMFKNSTPFLLTNH